MTNQAQPPSTVADSGSTVPPQISLNPEHTAPETLQETKPVQIDPATPPTADGEDINTPVISNEPNGIGTSIPPDGAGDEAGVAATEEVDFQVIFTPSIKSKPMLTSEQIRVHLDRQILIDQTRGLRPYPVQPPPRVHPCDAEQIEDFVIEIECWGDLNDPFNYRSAERSLRDVNFCPDAITAILKDMPRAQRIALVYLEAVRVQQLEATEGLPEKHDPSKGYLVKTLTFPTLAEVTEPGDAQPVQDGGLQEKGGVLRSEVSDDDELVEVRFEPNTATPARPQAPAPAAAVPSPPVHKPKRPEAKLPDDVIPVTNAHYPSDGAGTISQRRLVKWIPEILTLPQYTAFDLFGELNGDMVDLVLFVNRVGSTCYVGNKYNLGARRKVIWETSVLGPLPVKGEKIFVRVISITKREE